MINSKYFRDPYTFKDINLMKDLEPGYRAHLLDVPKIKPTKLLRGSFTPPVGFLTRYTEVNGAELKEMEFDVEFRGSIDEIEKHKGKFFRDISLARVKADTDYLYQGEFELDDIVEAHRGYQRVTVKGMVEAVGNLIEVKLPNINSTFKYAYITNMGDLPVPVKLIIPWANTGIEHTIKGFIDMDFNWAQDYPIVVNLGDDLYDRDGYYRRYTVIDGEFGLVYTYFDHDGRGSNTSSPDFEIVKRMSRFPILKEGTSRIQYGIDTMEDYRADLYVRYRPRFI